MVSQHIKGSYLINGKEGFEVWTEQQMLPKISLEKECPLQCTILAPPLKV